MVTKVPAGAGVINLHRIHKQHMNTFITGHLYCNFITGILSQDTLLYTFITGMQLHTVPHTFLTNHHHTKCGCHTGEHT